MQQPQYAQRKRITSNKKHRNAVFERTAFRCFCLVFHFFITLFPILPAWFALASPQSLCFRFSGANPFPGNQEKPARMPAWFALASQQSLCSQFSGANPFPGNQEKPARMPAWFALASPQSLCSRFSGANHSPGNQEKPTRMPAWFALASPRKT